MTSGPSIVHDGHMTTTNGATMKHETLTRILHDLGESMLEVLDADDDQCATWARRSGDVIAGVLAAHGQRPAREIYDPAHPMASQPHPGTVPALVESLEERIRRERGALPTTVTVEPDDDSLTEIRRRLDDAVVTGEAVIVPADVVRRLSLPSSRDPE